MTTPKQTHAERQRSRPLPSTRPYRCEQLLAGWTPGATDDDDDDRIDSNYHHNRTGPAGDG